MPLHAARRQVRFASFADCSSSRRFDDIGRSASNSGFFEPHGVHVYNLASLDAGFRQRNSGFVPDEGSDVTANGKPAVRGCGYWLWKPQVILQTLEQARGVSRGMLPSPYHPPTPPDAPARCETVMCSCTLTLGALFTGTTGSGSGTTWPGFCR